jgi:sec-independent protein translocase protein TatC
LFYLGAAFAYFVVFPLVFAFLTGVAPEGVAVMTDITHYLDFVLTLFFAFGLAFEVPIATIMLVLAGVTTPQDLAAKRPYVIVGAFVIGMLLTPPDIISQTLLALPMWVLFEVGILFARAIVRAREGAERAGEDAAAGASPAVAAAAGTAAAGTVDEGDFRPLDDDEMEDEFSRIEREFAELERKTDEEAGASEGEAETSGEDETEYDHAADVNAADQAGARWSADDAADMLDEEDFPPRSASEALVDAKLQQVVALRATEAYAEARRLLYEVLSEGSPEQVKVARNILEQLDS